jgi:hypothetical protein
MLKKFAIGVASTALILSAFVPAFGVAQTGNTDITDHSSAISEATDNDTMDQSTTNTGLAADTLDIGVANAGLNIIAGSEDTNAISNTGAEAGWKSCNFANSTEIEFGEESGAKASNTAIDDHSGDTVGDPLCPGCGVAPGPVSAVATDDDNFTVTNRNIDTTFNGFTISVANAGLNMIICSEDENSIVAGSAKSMTDGLTVVNNLKATIGSGPSDCLGIECGTAEAINEDITDHSSATAVATDEDIVDVTVVNRGTTVNVVNASGANSGLNVIYDSEDNNSITSNSATANLTGQTFVNSTELNIGTGGGAKATNNGVDDHSLANATSTDNDTIKTRTSNTDTTVATTNVSVANSGGNIIAGSEDGNTISSGTATSTGTSTGVFNSTKVTTN